QVAQTMAYAHEQQVIHRDLKPHNIMVGRFGEVQVMDWGMAKRLGETNDIDESHVAANAQVSRSGSLTPTVTNHADATPNLSMNSSLVDPLMSLTQAGDVLGTPAYMAPEQARGEIAALSPASDVFGLGAMLFELLTGSRLYESPDGAQQVLAMAAEGAVEPSLKKLDSLDIDPRIVELCKKCLKPEMAQRLPTASHVAAEVTAYREGVELRLKQAELDRRSAEVRVAEERKRRRMAIFLTGTIAAAVLAGLLGVLWQRNAAIASANKAEKSAKGYSDVLDIVEKSFESVNPSQGANAAMPARDVLLNAFENLKQSDLDDEGRIVLLTKLSTCFMTIGEYKVAIPCAKANVELTTAKLGPDHPTTMLAVNNLGAIYAKAGMAKEAAPLLEKTLAQRTAQLGEDHPDTLTSQEDLASCYIVAERFDDAVKMLEIVLEARRDLKGLDDPETRNTMDSLAMAYQDASDTDIDSLNSITNLVAAYITSGQHLKALRMWEKTLKNFEDTAGANHPITLMYSHNMVVALVKAGLAQEGVELGEKTVKGRIEKLGADHPDTLQSMNNLAQAYERVGDFEKAVELYQQTVDGYTRKLGATDTNTLIPVIGLGNALRQAGRTDEAIELLEKHAEITKQAFGVDHHIAITCVNNLASAYSDAGQNDDAILLGNEVVALRKAKQGMRDRGTLISMNNLATFQMRAGKPEEAARLIRQAFEIAIEMFGPNHQDTLYFSNNLSEATRRIGKFDEARTLYEKTLAGQKAALGEDHPDTLRTINGLAHTLHQLGQLEESMTLYRQTLKMRRKILGDEHPDTLYSMHGIAGVARDAGQKEAALKIFRRTLAGRQKRLGNDHPRTAETLYQTVLMLLGSQNPVLEDSLLSSLRSACERHPKPEYLRA
ncbi:MAG: tetratricopeptide repeat-containing protein kinase family protein, partial [Planctomycetota bacterium]